MYVVRSLLSHRIRLVIWSCDDYPTWRWHDMKQTAYNGGDPLRSYALLQCEHITNCKSMYVAKHCGNNTVAPPRKVILNYLSGKNYLIPWFKFFPDSFQSKQISVHIKQSNSNFHSAHSSRSNSTQPVQKTICGSKQTCSPEDGHNDAQNMLR